jgi:hypothetical protein
METETIKRTEADAEVDAFASFFGKILVQLRDGHDLRLKRQPRIHPSYLREFKIEGVQAIR